MKSFALVELLIGEAAAIYSVQFDGEENHETEKFLQEFAATHTKDLKEILTLIEFAATKRGLQDHNCRPEGKYADAIVALPGKGRKKGNKKELRLYAIRLSVNTIILYKGGIKLTRTYQEDPVLNAIVEELQEIDKMIAKRIFPDKDITYVGFRLTGDLFFDLD